MLWMGSVFIFRHISFDRPKIDGWFYIVHRNQNWREGFFSCNSFDGYVPKQVVSNLTYSHVWNHLLLVHEETP
jgi:hypothetical protein